MKRSVMYIGVLIIFLFFLIGCSSNSAAPSSNTADAPSDNQNTNVPEIDYSHVQTEWSIGEGYFVAGIDIPAGTFDVVATGGIGYLSSPNDSANLRDDSYNDDFYSTSYKNFNLQVGDILEAKGVQVALTYSKVLSDVSGRTYDDSMSIKLTPGNYTVGKDIPAGIYNVKYISGDGGFVSSDRNEGDYIINSNIDGDPSTGEYVDLVHNIQLIDNEEFTVTSGLTVAYIPAVQ